MAFEFEKELAAFTQIMRDKLNENQHKPKWKKSTKQWLYNRLNDERKELREALINNISPMEIARECADVACFAMMIADNTGGLQPSEQPENKLNFPKLLLNEKEKNAIKILTQYGGVDGSHHKAWVIDQALRALTGDMYNNYIRMVKDGEDGADTYTWDEGVAP